MKNIKIAPLTYMDNLKLNVNKEKIITIKSPEQAKDILKKVNAMVAELKAKGQEIIVGQSFDGKVAVSTQVGLKGKKSYLFPEPNPVHLFFSNAVEHFENAKILCQDFNKIDDTNHQQLFISFSKFFNEITSGIIMLYTSIEAFINQHIPEKLTFQIDGKVNTKSNIELMDIKQKIKDYLPIVLQINFQETNDKEYQKILKIRDIRNDLVHLKTRLTINKTIYEQLFSTLLNAKTDEFVNAVFVFMNTFRPNYLTEEQ